MRTITLNLILLFTVTANGIYAQNKAYKFGYVNSIELLEALPEKKLADQELEKFSQQQYKDLEDLYAKYQKSLQTFREGVKDGSLSDIGQEFLARDIQNDEQKIQQLQESAQEKLEEKKNKLYQPLIDKVNKAISEVAAEGGYTYIFDSSVGLILHADSSENLMAVFKKKLGISQ